MLGLVGRRQVHPRQRPPRRGAPGDRRGPRATTRAAATRRPTASCSCCPGGALLIDTPGIRSLEIAGADEGVETAFDDINALAAGLPLQRLPPRAASPAARSARALDDGSLSGDRLESQRKLERELAFAERKGDPRAQAEERKRWKAIHKSVGKHMDIKYGGDGMAMSTGLDDAIEVPDPPAIPGLRFRHLHAPEDYAGMAAANQRARDAAGIEEVITAESMARDYAHHVNCDPVDDILVVERDGVDRRLRPGRVARPRGRHAARSR